MKVTILGAGLVGNAIARDLANSGKFEVTSVDFDQSALDRLSKFKVQTLKADLSSREGITEVVRDADIVVGAVPGSMGFAVLKAVIEAGKNIVDISFFPEDAFELEELAHKNGVTAIVDCGVAPGMGNVILGYHDKQMEIKSYKCYVGGLPVKREWPYEYKAVFSPSDVIEEYVRPARYVQNGEMVVREALSDTELLEFDKIGTLEAWNSDGLRSLIKTMSHIPDMIEKTLRYPGSVEYLKVLRATGLFSEEPVEIGGTVIKPVDFISKLLFPLWKLKEGETEFTIMKIIIEGLKDNKKLKVQYDLLDYFDTSSGITSMARTTGYTCAAAVNLIAEGMVTMNGIFPPELLGAEEGNFKYMLKYLNDRGVIYIKS